MFFNSLEDFYIRSMTVQIDICKIKLEKDKKLGWILKLEGDCQKEMSILDELNPSKKRYLSNRVLKE